jgi:hypothetical protein
MLWRLRRLIDQIARLLNPITGYSLLPPPTQLEFVSVDN